ncbi:hypothetical protein IscW_ISCW018995 [Ixodes scapularis]|uniref:Uncharacterized protein n=1 Tax=Ixodes scapularis TaxID=6945 RepID=B7PNC6_IXOSC|nr:hypothetical protein IscW_ISCW018995 [Ixodes scapularis]|eukprot:XP_002435266.1 hypothetical protein IscW_ISCW018995 [Ixodes scapularis]
MSPYDTAVLSVSELSVLLPFSRPVPGGSSQTFRHHHHRCSLAFSSPLMGNLLSLLPPLMVFMGLPPRDGGREHRRWDRPAQKPPRLLPRFFSSPAKRVGPPVIRRREEEPLLLSLVHLRLTAL